MFYVYYIINKGTKGNCIVIYANINWIIPEPANICLKQMLHYQLIFLRGYGLGDNLFLYFSRTSKFIRLNGSYQTLEATACYCSRYQRSNEIDRNRILQDIHKAISLITSQYK